MTALIDSSVLLRMLFGEPDPLAEWSKLTDAFASRILLVGACDPPGAAGR